MFTKISISQIKPWSIFISLVVSGMLLAGCSMPLSVFPTPTPIPPSTIPSPTPILPSPTPIVPGPTTILPSPTAIVPLATPTAIPPTQTPLPIVSPTPVPGAIIFKLGTTAGVETGAIQPGQVISYTISAGQLQPMILILESPHKDVTLGLFEQNGHMLIDPAKKWNRWQAWLPKTEVYTIQVIGGASTESYTLTVKVAQIIKFATGATSITLPGKTINGFVFTYSVNAKKGQAMTVSLNVPPTTAYLDVFGIATGVLLSPTAKATTWTGILPETQDFLIEVIPNNGQVVNYSITITIP